MKQIHQTLEYTDYPIGEIIVELAKYLNDGYSIEAIGSMEMTNQGTTLSFKLKK